MGLKNTIRNVFNIRKERSIAPAGPMPKIGSSVVRERLRIRLKYPISSEQWEWFTARGWRTVDMRSERRQYTTVPDKILVKLLEKEGLERDALHRRLVMPPSAARKSAPAPATAKPAERSVSDHVVAD